MKTIPVRKINTIQKPSGFAESFSIRNLRDILAGKDMAQGLHRHEYFFVLALEKGKGEHMIDFTPYPVTDHTVFFLRPGQVHQLTLKAGSTGYLMEFKNDFYSPRDKISYQLLSKASNKNLCQLESKRFKKIFSILTDIFQEYSDKAERYPEAIKANLDIFFIELVRQRRNLQDQSKSGDLHAQKILEEFLELLEAHFLTDKQVSFYTDNLHLSPYQLNAITKALLGKTSSELINEQVILEAKRQLLATSNTINQIADHLGYEDVSYFIRFFKKHTGHSPAAFRNNLR
jgi:AraC-like DNA-binding protein